MATVSYAITTKAKVKTYLGITDSASDDFIDTLINYVTDFVEGYCGGRRFLRSTISNEVHDTNNVHNIFLKNYPVISLTTVEYRSGTFSSPTWNTYNADGYLLYGDEGYIYFAGMLPVVKQGIRVTYVAGYLIDWNNETNSSLHTLPLDLTAVATELVARLYQNRATDGILSQSTEGQSVTFMGNSGDISKYLNGLHASILGKYQAVRLTR